LFVGERPEGIEGCTFPPISEHVGVAARTGGSDQGPAAVNKEQIMNFFVALVEFVLNRLAANHNQTRLVG